MSLRLNKITKVAPSTMEEALENFLSWKKASSLSEQTILDYKTHVNLLFKRFPDAKKSYEHLEKAARFDSRSEDKQRLEHGQRTLQRLS